MVLWVGPLHSNCHLLPLTAYQHIQLLEPSSWIFLLKVLNSGVVELFFGGLDLPHDLVPEFAPVFPILLVSLGFPPSHTNFQNIR